MRKEIILVCVIFMVLFTGCAQRSLEDVNQCGDGTCTLTEDCNNCPSDCGCKALEICDVSGICRSEVCGDEICSSKEKSTDSCCEDCGCENDLICNKVNQKCQEKIDLEQDYVEKTVEDYLKAEGIEGKISAQVDAYYKEEMIKEVVIDCSKEGSDYPCEVRLVINKDGKILEEIRTT